MTSRSIRIVSDIAPDALNRGGPSGLLFEILKALEEQGGARLTAEVHGLPNDRILRRAAQLLLLPSRPTHKEWSDRLLVYPSTAIRHVPPEARHRAIVLGPDSLSLLFGRAALRSGRYGLSRARLIACRFRRSDRWLARSLARYAVVGRADRRWIAHLAGPSGRVFYLPHPLLSASLLPLPALAESLRNARRPTLLFSGANNAFYSAGLFGEVTDRLLANPAALRGVRIRLVGSAYKRLAERFALSGADVSWQEWIPDYRELFLGRVVQPVILAVGAGTKTRTLTALANGAAVVGTPVALENCAEPGIPLPMIRQRQADRLAAAVLELIETQPGQDLPDRVEAFRRERARRFRLSLADLLSA